MVPSSIGPYRIIEGLGSGANGEVYLAEDMRLGRKVAVKTLSALGSKELTEARRWVLREARAAARLNHPNIASVYDVLESPEGAHIVMEYVRGETLMARLSDGPLPPPQVLEIAIQLADALCEAHAMGVVHRDLKPSNVAVTAKGKVKILDFGLAQVRPVEPGSTPVRSSRDFTLEGRQVGTPPYMPPEHLMGDPVDVRGDIYSLGVMLFELLTGRRPFQGADAMALTMAILTHPTPRASGSNAAVPAALDAIVFRAMSRMPQDRYASASEMAADLRRAAGGELLEARTKSRTTLPKSRRSWLAVATAGAVAAVVIALAAFFPNHRTLPDRKSIAVLPLKNLSPDPENAYFSDGITEDIVAQLSKIGDLKVISGVSAAAYKRNLKSGAEIGKELDVATILEGSVRRAGNRIRIVSQLADVGTNQQLWADTYDRDLTDIFDIQAEVAGRIATALKGELSLGEKARLAQRRTEDPELFTLYLKGRYHWSKRTRDDLEKSVASFEQAIHRDPKYAPAYAGLADSYISLGANGFLPRELARSRARAAATKALEIDDTLAEAHTSLALVKHEELDWVGAETGYRRAIKLNPNNPSAHHWYATYLIQVGRRGEAIAEIKRAQELDPLSLTVNGEVGIMLYLAGRYQEAIKQLQVTIEIDPGFAPVHAALAEAYTYAGSYEPAVAEIQRAISLAPARPEFQASLGYIYAVTKKREQAQRILEELKRFRGNAYVAPGSVAAIYAGLGDNDRAFEWLEKAYVEHDVWIPYLMVERKFDSLRPDPRFAELAKKVGLDAFWAST